MAVKNGFIWKVNVCIVGVVNIAVRGQGKEREDMVRKVVLELHLKPHLSRGQYNPLALPFKFSLALSSPVYLQVCFATTKSDVSGNLLSQFFCCVFSKLEVEGD